MKLNKILVPTDCSESSARAIAEAVSLANLNAAATDSSGSDDRDVGCTVDVLHVTPSPGGYYPLDRWIWGEEGQKHQLDTRISEVARERFDTFLASLPHEVRDAVRPSLETGVSYDVIVKVAKEGDYDLIIMGTHGRTGVNRVMLGSVAERVLRLAECPVLVVR